MEKLLEALRYIENETDAYAVCEPGTCKDCDLLIKLREVARSALKTHLHERLLTQQCSGQEIAETLCLDCGFDYGSSNCQGCKHYSRRR